MSISLPNFTTTAPTIADNRLPAVKSATWARFFGTPPLKKNNLRSSCSLHFDDSGSPESPELIGNSVTDQDQGSSENSGKLQRISSNEILGRLKRYGVSGILAYGLLNTIYYLTTFLIVWFYVTPPPGKLGYLTAIGRFFKVMGAVWAGSQVTKLIRAGGALALAPFVERGLSWFTTKFGFESQAKSCMAIAGICFALALFVFFVVTLICI